MAIRPVYDNVAVERVNSTEKIGSIIIPDTVKEKPSEGIVIAVGDGVRDKDGKFVGMAVKPGDRILFSKWGGNEIKVDGKELVMVKETDIIGIIE